MSLTPEETKSYEQYLLAGDDEAACQKAISMNVMGSESYFYLYFLHKFKTVGVNGLTEAEQADLKTFISQQSKKAKEIKQRYDILRLDDPQTTEEERSKIIDDIKSKLYMVRLNHSKPELADSVFENESEVGQKSLKSILEIMHERKEETVEQLVNEMTEIEDKLKEARKELEKAQNDGTEDIDEYQTKVDEIEMELVEEIEK